MSLYQKIKSAITVRQVGEMYGMEPDRHGMVCCPFHSDSDPSMKLNDTYYYCFGCGANGDAIDLTAKLFDLNPRQAAEKLIHDFGLDPDKPPANAIALPPPKRGLTDEQWADIAYCLRVLTDYLDLLLLHWLFANYYAAWRTLEKLYGDGRVRAIGVSNFEPDRLLDLIAYNKIVPAVDQIETNLYCQRGAERVWMDKKQVAHMAYAPLGQSNRNEMFQEPAVLALARKYGKTPAQILLRFLTQNGIAVIPRGTRPEHIRENFVLFDFTLTLDEMAQLAALDRKEPLIGRPEAPELVEFSLTWKKQP